MLICLVLALVSGCGDRNMPSAHIDADWFWNSLIHQHVEKILQAAPAGTQGRFRYEFHRDWSPKGDANANSTMQSRILYGLAVGYTLTRDPLYQKTLRQGADYLVESMVDPDYGGVFESVGPDGKPGNPDKRLYSQAFAIFGLSHAYQATGDRVYLDTALSIWRTVKSSMRDAQGGFVARMDQGFHDKKDANNQNPVMHLFEALLALHWASGSKEILADARGVAEFVTQRLLQTGRIGTYIPEYYDDRWIPLSDASDGYVDLGHQVEWAFLLSVGVQQGLPANYGETGWKLLESALRTGYDPVDGGLFWRSDYQGRVEKTKIWWVQSELLRALMRYAARHGHGDLWSYFDKSLSFVRSEFCDDEHGGWYIKPLKVCRKSDCLDTQADVGYHIVAMHVEALALTLADPPGP